MGIRQARKIIRQAAWSDRPVAENLYQRAHKKISSWVGRGIRRARKEK